MKDINVDYKNAEIGNDVKYMKDIIPVHEVELERSIIIGHRSIVGNLYGKSIEIKSGEGENPTSVQDCYGIDQVKIGDFCKITGIVQSTGKIRIGEDIGNVVISKDIIGKEIIISKNCQINGCVIAEEDLIIGANSIINGFAVSLNKKVKIASNSKVFDVIAGEEIEIDNNVCINDPIIWCGKLIKHQRLKLGCINDLSASKGTIFSKMKGFDIQGEKGVKKENEINPYNAISDTSEVFDFDKILEDLN